MNIDTRTIVVAAILAAIAVLAYLLLVPTETGGPDTATPPAATDTAPAPATEPAPAPAEQPAPQP